MRLNSPRLRNRKMLFCLWTQGNMTLKLLGSMPWSPRGIQFSQHKKRQIKHEGKLSLNHIIQASTLIPAWTFMLIWVGFLSLATSIGQYVQRDMYCLSTFFLLLLPMPLVTKGNPQANSYFSFLLLTAGQLIEIPSWFLEYINSKLWFSLCGP